MITGLVLWSILHFSAAISAGEAAGTNALEQASDAHDRGDIETALDICETSLKKSAADRTLLSYCADILPEGSVKRASGIYSAFKGSAAKDGDHAYYLALCKLARNSEQLQDAILHCKKARELSPTIWTVYRELGLTYSKSGNPKKARETLEQSVELSPGNHEALYYLAKEHEKQGDNSRALKNYRQALDIITVSGNIDTAAHAAEIGERIRLLTLRAPKKAPAKTAVKKPVPARKTFDSCIADARSLKKSEDNRGAEKKLTDCAAIMALDAQTLAELADLRVRLGRYEAAVQDYQRAASLFGKKDPMAAVCYIKTAQTYSKLGDGEKAELYYAKALEINPNDLNAMSGLAGAREAKADLSGAAVLYEKILKAEPANARARERLDELEFKLLSNAQILEELKDRRAVEPARTEPSPEDLKTLKILRQAEKNGAVDYVKIKTGRLQDFAVTKQAKDRVRLLLTLPGLKIYRHYLTREAVVFFEKKQIKLGDVFALRDLKGAPMFDSSGKLTDEGLEAYWRALNGTKTWLRTYETVPEGPKEEKMNAQAGDLIKAGFREISQPEYSWLARLTTCPDKVLLSQPCDIRLLKSDKLTRYYLCYSRGAPCSTKETEILTAYIERYRSGDTSIPEGDYSTAFFGSGAVKRKRFCEDGKLWAEK